MNWLFIEATIFTRMRRSYLNDGEFNELQNLLLMYPLTGDVIQGTGGLRKLRFKRGTSGKRGGLRVIYCHRPCAETIYLLTI